MSHPTNSKRYSKVEKGGRNQASGEWDETKKTEKQNAIERLEIQDDRRKDRFYAPKKKTFIIIYES